MAKSTITVTFGDVAGSGVGAAQRGLQLEDLKILAQRWPEKQWNIWSLDCGEGGIGYLLVVHQAFPGMTIYDELWPLNWDKKGLNRGRVVNKKARYNLSFGLEAVEPDYDHGQPRMISFNQVPALAHAAILIHHLVPQIPRLVVQANHYYDKECYLGFHGDRERRITVGLRLGLPMGLQFQRFLRGEAVGEPLTLTLNNGDLYFMSEKMTGRDWLTRDVPTIRHRAGYDILSDE